MNAELDSGPLGRGECEFDGETKIHDRSKVPRKLQVDVMEVEKDGEALMHSNRYKFYKRNRGARMRTNSPF